MPDEIKEWTLSRIEGMIRDKIPEDFALDYKHAGALDKNKATEITKDVSSFANSDGGVLIYGVSEDKEKHFPEKITPVDFSLYSKEWLESVIEQIRPKISGVRIYPIYAVGELTKGLYVVVVLKGDTAHQALDCCYHRRGNFKTEAMKDYEVRDVMNRNAFPRVKVMVSGTLENRKFKFTVPIGNVGTKMIKHWRFVASFPESIAYKEKVYSLRAGESIDGHLLRKYSRYEQESKRTIEFSENGSMVFFPNSLITLTFWLTGGHIINGDLAECEEMACEFWVYADDMPPFISIIKFHDLFSDLFIELIPEDKVNS